MSLSRVRFGTPAVSRSVLVAVGAVTVALAGCAPADSGTSTATSSTGSAAQSSAATSPGGLSADCAKDKLTLVTASQLTVGTDKPAFEPWFSGDDPSNGKGFESAVAYAVADKLGFAPSDVSWVTASFSSAIAPGAKKYDFDINQISITDARKAVIDFSSGYYDVSQAVVTVKGSKAATVKTIADLATLKLGAQTATTSFTAINQVIKPSKQPSVFNTNDDAKLALTNGQIDAIVVDLPTALFLSAVGTADGGLDNGVLVGQLPNGGGTAEQFGLALDKGNKLTPCVTQAVDALRADGTLKKLEQQWLTDTAGAPVLP